MTSNRTSRNDFNHFRFAGSLTPDDFLTLLGDAYDRDARYLIKLAPLFRRGQNVDFDAIATVFKTDGRIRNSKGACACALGHILAYLQNQGRAPI
jgi:hypothetical protein